MELAELFSGSFAWPQVALTHHVFYKTAYTPLAALLSSGGLVE
jgi:hypothetical protein